MERKPYNIAVWIRCEVRLPVPQDQKLSGNTGMALLNLSPDGEHLVYAASGRLYLRSMSDATPRPIPGTEGNPESPVFSPDGQSIAFFMRTEQGGSTPGGLPQGVIKRVRLTGGTPVPV